MNGESTEDICERVLPKHEPISPVHVKVEPFTHHTSPPASAHVNNDNGSKKLLVRIPLSQLLRPPVHSSLTKVPTSELVGLC